MPLLRSLAASLVLVAACARPASNATRDADDAPQRDADAGRAPDPDAALEAVTRDVVLANRPRLRVCYEDALAKKPTLEGKVVLVVDVGQNGRAAHVLEGHREGLDEDVVRCLARVLRTIAFHDGAARAIRIQIPFVFARVPDNGPDGS